MATRVRRIVDAAVERVGQADGQPVWFGKALVEADEQLSSGCDLGRLQSARDNLDAVASGCLIVRLLDRKIARMAAETTVS